MNKKIKTPQRKPLSLIRLYKLASKFTVIENPKVDTAVILEFLKYISEHKNDTL